MVVFEEEVVVLQMNIIKSKEILLFLRMNVFQLSLIEAIHNETRRIYISKVYHSAGLSPQNGLYSQTNKLLMLCIPH